MEIVTLIFMVISPAIGYIGFVGILTYCVKDIIDDDEVFRWMGSVVLAIVFTNGFIDGIIYFHELFK
jgi:hypothetical protein